jgi:hypothetical protein
MYRTFIYQSTRLLFLTADISKIATPTGEVSGLEATNYDDLHPAYNSALIKHA